MSTSPLDFETILALPEGIERTAALAAWFQSLFSPGAEVPILVGGAAVEIYSGGAYTSGDLDFVGEVDAGLAERWTGETPREEMFTWTKNPS